MNRRRIPTGDPSRPDAKGEGGKRGFTLIELLVVMAIIGIILSLVLLAGLDAIRRAEERATQSLITKLEQGLNDRLEALLQNQPDPNYTHGYLAAVCSSLAANKTTNSTGMIPTPYVTIGGIGANGTTVDNPAVKQTSRAQVIALYDYIKAAMPDVFYVQNYAPSTTGTGSSQYPLNFAGVPLLQSYNLPFGTGVTGPFMEGGLGDGIPSVSNPTLGPAGSGIFGASYGAAAGLYKGLGYTPLGYDGVDNDGDGQIDNYAEGLFDTVSGMSDPPVTAPDNPKVTIPHLSVLISTRLANHTHNTARAEVLYALLVEGSGPLGSVFKREDFTDKEVQDTDGDGMLEFVDAWGQPLQFFRWPVFYHSDLQRGQNIIPDSTTPGQYDLVAPYYDPANAASSQIAGVLQQREQDPLDPNQQLMAPAWWASSGVGGLAANDSYPSGLVATSVLVPSGASGGVQAFEALFHPLSEPLTVSTSTNSGTFWDRGVTFPARRAFYSKFLILSGGPDSTPGVFLYADGYLKPNSATNPLGLANPAAALIANENNALQFSIYDVADFTSSATVTNTTFLSAPSNDPTQPSSYDLNQAAQDDISNHNLQSGGAIGGSG